MCNWRRSLKIAFQNKKIIQAVNEREKVQWIFLTLTIRNVEGDKLKDMMDRMTKAWNNFSRYAKFRKSVKGYFRAMEVTRDRDETIIEKRYKKASKYYDSMGLSVGDENFNYGTYHPHFHVLLAVPNSYFKKKDFYITQADWTSRAVFKRTGDNG